MPQKIVFADGKEKRVLPIPGEALHYFPATELKEYLEYRKDNRDTQRMAKALWRDIEEIIFLNPTEEEAKLINDNRQSVSLICDSRFCEWCLCLCTSPERGQTQRTEWRRILFR